MTQMFYVANCEPLHAGLWEILVDAYGFIEELG